MTKVIHILTGEVINIRELSERTKLSRSYLRKMINGKTPTNSTMYIKLEIQ